MKATGKAIRTVDLFCGAGGSSCGAREAGAQIVAAVDAWDTAIATYRLNFPNAKTWIRDLRRLSGKYLSREVGSVDLLLASPECTNHTFAKGNRREGEIQEKSRRTAFEVSRFAAALEPRWIVVENVVSMRRWNQYGVWLERLTRLGFHLREVVLDSQEFGVPQSRRRLFVIGDREVEPKLPKASCSPPVPISHVLHTEEIVNGFNFKSSPLFGCGRAKDTLARAERAIAAIGRNSPFLIVYYGTDAAGGWQTIDRPLRTITTLDRFAIVRPTGGKHVMRMLQPPELAAAMGFPECYKWVKATRRDRIKLVGNAVCPPVMKSVVSALTGSTSNHEST